MIIYQLHIMISYGMYFSWDNMVMIFHGMHSSLAEMAQSDGICSLYIYCQPDDKSAVNPVTSHTAGMACLSIYTSVIYTIIGSDNADME